MKRLALALAAAAALGTGCGPGPCRRAVTVDWNAGFLGADNVKRGCAAAGVTWVDLFINDDPNSGARFDCTAFTAQAVDLAGGANLFTVEGVDANQRIAYRAEVSLDATCGDQHVSVTPAEGTLAVDYTFTPADVCFATQPTYIWTKVRDDIAGQTAFVDTGTGSANLCAVAPAPAPTYRLPAGSYTFLGINEWSPTAGYVGADCRHPTFVVEGARTTTVSPVLADSSVACF